MVVTVHGGLHIDLLGNHRGLSGRHGRRGRSGRRERVRAGLRVSVQVGQKLRKTPQAGGARVYASGRCQTRGHVAIATYHIGGFFVDRDWSDPVICARRKQKKKKSVTVFTTRTYIIGIICFENALFRSSRVGTHG